ncbi:protein kinase domain protein [Ichthyophthirius multifiliis]|uniref:Protein kinase domain protein n=1 Tax=Ichthyophthirius multifiliis TaxID=5932 RepID=G0R636_ICHMU|nr:protein kinase domain protein [Ichthyophthirius multifiliis]EGR27059.1 protein kinase domain protein [Ichthyophthirius multifiliis]|eukprot:XP_004023943.1 protein kinase domain protein [Ichthyophthirius multifiliis]
MQDDVNKLDLDCYNSLDLEYLRFLKHEEKKDKIPQISLDSFNLLTIIGQGNYAKVSLVCKKDDGQVYALKALKKKYLQVNNQINQVLTERNILQTVNNKYIVKMKYAFQDKKKLFFVLEFCPGGDLFTLLQTKEYLNEKQTKFYAAQIIKAFEYLHSYNIIYRDLKPENVLIDSEGYIKLTDFGLSKMDITHEKAAISFCGTPEYLSPEIILQQGHGKASDWWTLGNIIYEMIIGTLPFYDINRYVLFENIKTKPFKEHEKIQGNLKNLIEGLLQKNPEKRLGSINGAQDIINHPWFSDLNWDHLRERIIQPPFKPKLENSVDVSYIAQEFLELPIFSPEESLQSGQSLGIQSFFLYIQIFFFYIFLFKILHLIHKKNSIFRVIIIQIQFLIIKKK